MDLISLDRARNLNNGQPSALARWISALDLKAGDRVFHLGCGVGYYTAIIAEVVGAEGEVMACEVDAGLAAQARENLASYANVTVQCGDGAAIDPGVCQATFINAGVTHPHRRWLDRLPQAGRLVLPLTSTISGAGAGGSGVMAKIVREQGGLSAQAVSLVGIYSCTSVRDPDLDPLLAKALASRALLKLKSVRVDHHEQTETCVVHGRDLCLSNAPVTDG
jgi:protein-L-isoaspartate(D-aspartate) O-methyltransferase